MAGRENERKGERGKGKKREKEREGWRERRQGGKKKNWGRGENAFIEEKTETLGNRQKEKPAKEMEKGQERKKRGQRDRRRQRRGSPSYRLCPES